MTEEVTTDSKLRNEALEAEIARSRAEKLKMEAETTEIQRRLRWNILGLTPSTIFKTILGGFVAGTLFWSFGLNHLLSVHRSSEIRLGDLEKQERALSAKNQVLAADNEALRRQVVEVQSQLKDTKNSLLLIQTPSSEAMVAKLDGTLSWLESEAYRLEHQASDFGSTEAVPPSASSNDLEGRWVYVGDYRNGEWKTHYFTIDLRSTPAELRDKMSSSTTAMNVRERPYFGDVISYLRQGVRVRFIEIHVIGMGDNGYVWGRIP